MKYLHFLWIIPFAYIAGHILSLAFNALFGGAYPATPSEIYNFIIGVGIGVIVWSKQ